MKVRGNHSLRSDVKALSAAVEAWLPAVLAPAAGRAVRLARSEVG